MSGRTKVAVKIEKSWKNIPKNRISYSELNQYVNMCQLQHRFQRIDKIKSKVTGANLHFGNAFEYAWRAFYKGQKTLDGLIKIFKASWKRECKSPTIVFDKKRTKAEWEEAGVACIKKMLKEGPDLEVIEPDALHITADALFSSGAHVTDRLIYIVTDMLGADGSKIVVHDCKTKGREPFDGELDMDLQATVYLYVIQHAYPDAEVEFMWHNYITTKDVKFKPKKRTRSVSDYDRMMDLIVAMERQIESGVAIPRREINNYCCKGCSYRELCDSWHKAIVP